MHNNSANSFKTLIYGATGFWVGLVITRKPISLGYRGNSISQNS